VTCGDDPAIFREFFKMCDLGSRATARTLAGGDKANRAQVMAKYAEVKQKTCSGLTLSGARTPWALLHNNTAKYKSNNGSDTYAAITRLEQSVDVWREILRRYASELHRGTGDEKKATLAAQGAQKLQRAEKKKLKAERVAGKKEERVAKKEGN